MKKLSLKLAGSLSLLGVIGAIASSPALAETQTSVAQMSQAMSSDPVAQSVTSVSQLSDVKPTDWAFTALQSLVERYGCIAGYPDRTFRGKQATGTTFLFFTFASNKIDFPVGSFPYPGANIPAMPDLALQDERRIINS